MKLEPNNAGLYVHRGLLLLQWKGDINEALKLLEKAIEVDDKCEFAYETLGTVEVQRGELLSLETIFFNNFCDCSYYFREFGTSYCTI